MPLARISLVALLLAAACGGQQSDAPPRSPSLDYPPPPVETSNGEVVGADRVPPRDKLEQGPKAGSEGVQPAAGPGGVPEQRSGKPSPCTDIGLEDAQGKSRCKKAPAK
jgi:hypothetical protein